MSPDIAEAIRHEHNATMAVMHHANARAVNVGKLLLEVRETMEPFAWITWLETQCPIPKSAAHRTRDAELMRTAVNYTVYSQRRMGELSLGLETAPSGRAAVSCLTNGTSKRKALKAAGIAKSKEKPHPGLPRRG